MVYQESQTTNATNPSMGDLEKELKKQVREIGEEMMRLTGRGERTRAFDIYYQQSPEIQERIRRRYSDAVKSSQLSGI